MNLGWTQLLLILFVAFLLFGNSPQKIQELSKAFQKVRKEWREEDKKKSSLLEGGGPKFPNRFGI